MDDIVDLKTSIEVVEHGGVSAAAAALDVASSTVSYRVADIELRPSTRPFHRDRRHIAPTEEGRQLWLRSGERLGALRDAEQEARGGATGVRGAWKVTLPPWGTNVVIAPHLANFRSPNSGLLLEFLATDRLVDLVAGA